MAVRLDQPENAQWKPTPLEPFTDDDIVIGEQPPILPEEWGAMVNNDEYRDEFLSRLW